MSQTLLKYGIKKELGKFNKEGQVIKRKEIRDTCDVSRVTVSIWENALLGDKAQIGIDHASEIARILGCRMEDLVNEKGFESA